MHCNTKLGVSVLKHPEKKRHFCILKFLQKCKKKKQKKIIKEKKNSDLR